MARGLSDTAPEIDARIVAAFARMSVSAKLRRVFDLTQATRELSAARIRREHTELTPREVEIRVAALIYGRDLVRRATGVDPGAEYDD